MTRTIAVVPVRVGSAVIPVSVAAQSGAATHVEVQGNETPRIIVDDDLSPALTSREIESVLPEVQRILARRFLN